MPAAVGKWSSRPLAVPRGAPLSCHPCDVPDAASLVLTDSFNEGAPSRRLLPS